MPKIIENLEERLLQEARRQIAESGYGATTIRSVAKGCGVGVGTVYNYFPSKDALLASYMLEDWKTCVAAINVVAAYSDTPAPVVRCICDQLISFSDKHQKLFRDEGAAASFAGSFSHYHSLLRAQLSLPLQKFCRTGFAADFIAEALLTWTMAGKTFDELYGMIAPLF